MMILKMVTLFKTVPSSEHAINTDIIVSAHSRTSEVRYALCCVADHGLGVCRRRVNAYQDEMSGGPFLDVVA